MLTSSNKMKILKIITRIVLVLGLLFLIGFFFTHEQEEPVNLATDNFQIQQVFINKELTMLMRHRQMVLIFHLQSQSQGGIIRLLERRCQIYQSGRKGVSGRLTSVK